MSDKARLKLPIKYFLFSIVPLFFSIGAQAQLESSKWIFGNGAGIDFINGNPASFSGSKINTTEGCASLSTSRGDLLFYTDGVSAWNRNHELMPNGNNLHGHISSTQSVIITPKPGSKTLFYIFTLDSEADKNGFSYSVADISKENGLGDIVVKNQFIRNSCTERIAAVKHKNNRDIWIIIHEYESDAFLAYLLTSEGFSQEPVVSKAGVKHEKSKFNNIGYLKASFDRKKLALAITGDKIVQTFDFDTEKGLVSDPVTIRFEENLSPYGVEFSPNNKLLYVGIETRGRVYQIDLSNYTEKAMQKSLCLVGQNKCYFGALQLGMDGKIYIAEYKSKTLSVIEKPNIQGLECSFKTNAITLANGSCMFGLPTFFQEYVKIYSLNQIKQFFNEKTETKLNETYILSRVYFDFNKATFRRTSEKELRQLAGYLKRNLTLKIEITGHTDSIGSQEYNERLSIARSKNIGAFLNQNGVELARIMCSGKGSNEPISSNDSERGRQKNRRAEFVVNK